MAGYFSGKTYFITGASRGIGKAVALKLAAGGARIVVAAKTVTPHPKLEGTIFTAADEIVAAGGEALPVACDIRDERMVADAVAQAHERFGGIDGVINNASAIALTGTADTAAKRYDLMMDINVRGAFFVTRHCLPFLKESANPHIINFSPPVTLNPEWMAAHVAYTISKFNMTMLSIAWAKEFAPFGIAANSLWPVTTIATAAVRNLLGGEALVRRSRRPDIMADAVDYILRQPAAEYTGQQLLDEDVLRQAGITDLSGYAVDKGVSLQKDLFL